MNFTEREVGQLQAKVNNLESEVHLLREDVKQILSELAHAKGSWKTLIAIAGLSSAVGAGLMKLITIIPVK